MLICAVAATAAAALAGCGGRASSPPATTRAGGEAFAGQPVLPDSSAADFSLPDQRGRTVTLSGERGRIVLLTFLYTRCRDVCPTIADHLDQAVRSLGRQRSRVRVIAVSVDPEHDTPGAVRAFMREHRLGSEFSYLTAPRARLQPVWQAYNVLATPRNSQVVDHSAPTLLLDARGRPRVYYESSFSAASVAHDLRRLL